MSAQPIIDTQIIEQEPLIMPGTPASESGKAMADVSRLSKGDRRFRVFSAQAGFDILPTIDRVADYCIEPNIFFSPRFAIPAMPRLDDRDVRLMVLQDQGNAAAETRFLMPFTIEKPGFAIGPDLLRAWATPYGPLGLPLIERREAAQVVEDLFATIATPSVNLPKIVAFPQVLANSPVVSLIRSVALSNGLPMAATRPIDRIVLDATKDADQYFKEGVGGHHRREFGRQWRKLEAEGELTFDIARTQAEIREAAEEFFLLESAGWKGRQRTALASDRYRAAFAREAINNLGEADKCRIHALKLDGKVIASLIVFVEGGRAWTWKTAFDENLSAFSPGKLLMVRATEALMDDPNIIIADSCAADGHSMMGQLWQEREPMVTLVVGLDILRDRDVRQAAAQIDLYDTTKKTAKNVQARLKNLIGKK